MPAYKPYVFLLQIDTTVNNKEDVKCVPILGLDPKPANLPQSVIKKTVTQPIEIIGLLSYFHPENNAPI